MWQSSPNLYLPRSIGLVNPAKKGVSAAEIYGNQTWQWKSIISPDFLPLKLPFGLGIVQLRFITGG
jgi:hypothetical protein